MIAIGDYWHHINDDNGAMKWQSPGRDCQMVTKAIMAPFELLIGLIYEGTGAKFFGVLQSHTLAPYLFVIVINYCTRKLLLVMTRSWDLLLNRGEVGELGQKNVADINFADDIALLPEEIRAATELLLQDRICCSYHRVVH